MTPEKWTATEKVALFWKSKIKWRKSHTSSKEEIVRLLHKNSKYSKNTTRRMTSAIWRVSADLNIPIYHEIAEKNEMKTET